MAQQQTSPEANRQLRELTPQERAIRDRNLTPKSNTDARGWRYHLEVVQQPVRARMCGFGDKDRRPITSPPCVKLIVVDAGTGEEIPINNIDYSTYILTVDLWNEDATEEVNLVKSGSSSNAISLTQQASYNTAMMALENPAPPPQPYPPRQQYGPPHQYGGPQQFGPPPPQPPQQFGHPPQPPQQFGHPSQPYPHQQYPPTQPYGQHYQPVAFQGHHPPVYPENQAYGFVPPQPPVQRASISGAAPQGMFTRNLIGSLAASAFRLNDNLDKIGIWFILQDLSVRTEGFFRLRFSFVDVGAFGQSSNSNTTITTGAAPVLASVFSEPFQVYSAKKFPGVCESTELSKVFAGQGIKIPIRKDNAGGRRDDDDGENV